MAKQTVNIGSGELAGDGESLRSAFDKINDNFDDLYLASGGIALTDLSVSADAASGGGSLSYNNTTGASITFGSSIFLSFFITYLSDSNW